MEETVLNIFDKIDSTVHPQSIKACHRLKSVDNGQSNKVIVKFSKRKDVIRVIVKRIFLKNANLDGTALPPNTSLFFNLSLHSYYKYLWSNLHSGCQMAHYE